MEELINDKLAEYYIEKRSRLQLKTYNYYYSEIELYYIKNIIIYVKNQYKLLTSDRRVLFTILYRQLCQCYKKKINVNRLWWYNHGRYKKIICTLLDIECFYILNHKNITLIPMTYYTIIWDMSINFTFE